MSLLRGNELFRSGDLDYVRDQVGRVFCPHRLELAGHGARLDARMRTKWLRTIGINLVGYGGEVLVGPGLLNDFLVIMIPLTGHALVRSGNEDIESHPGLATIPHPDRPLTMRWSADCVKLIVRIERSCLEANVREHFGHALDDRPIDFRPDMDVASGYGAGWANLALTIAHDLDDEPSLFDDTLLARTWEQILMLSLFRAQSGFGEPESPARSQIASRRHVNAALAAIRHRVDEPWTIERLAREVGTGKRSLQSAFQDAGSTFTGELRDARLRKARDILRVSAPGSVNVASVFARCGLQHHGRASGRYRALFGERPTDTLQR
ncbi:helix-turn-helix domain-containing protein [Amycolatopsis rubida]|uniref:Helix-turn-helix domain-containing protein n=1 Tax=Amycolatopsis rubida TaxID=112413 RepID=A0ABX0C1J8_9PSEU|nr:MULTISPECIES: helix-turn-helix domain-containing protein [Amycolatopsis]MYW94353.1 helix-turn-helix domain-containing protein [Amycolatopsis rubida]NEC59342.1 helix-turn-helix domain-containing protein [Amycolatopsis rubida]OAP26838.1 transcriptional activator FtrA [Amycolatopsis sp. M39]